jgi:hypothetical protein
MSRSDWDLDLRFGQEGEVVVNSLLTAPIETVEVKRDRRWIETGNLYIETECWSDVLSCWYASGITTSKASHWSFVLEDTVLIIPTDSVRKAIAVFGMKREMNRPEYSTRGFTITVADLLKITSRRRQSASQSQSSENLNKP